MAAREPGRHQAAVSRRRAKYQVSDTVIPIPWPTLPTGDRPSTRTNSFTMTADQSAMVMGCVAQVRSSGMASQDGANQNGNALAHIVAFYMAAHGVS